ncbi:MAG: hypothetical protein IKQ25_01830 [Lachnospiraceae bacterium]|nr:hypothetical protein [Lachnospiraceae bacterium]
MRDEWKTFFGILKMTNHIIFSLYRGRKAARGIKTMIFEKYHSVFELNEEERK